MGFLGTLLTALIPAVVSAAIAGYCAVALANSQFRKERLWDKRNELYMEILSHLSTLFAYKCRFDVFNHEGKKRRQHADSGIIGNEEMLYRVFGGEKRWTELDAIEVGLTNSFLSLMAALTVGKEILRDEFTNGILDYLEKYRKDGSSSILTSDSGELEAVIRKLTVIAEEDLGKH